MLKKNSLAVFVLLFLVFLGGFVFFNSAKLADLEKDIIMTSDIKIVSVEKFTFGKGGFVMVGQDRGGRGILKAYTEMPIINRYMETKALRFSNEDQPVRFAGESWSGNQALSYLDGTLNVKSSAEGVGFPRRIPLWIILSALASFVIVVGLKRLRK